MARGKNGIPGRAVGAGVVTNSGRPRWFRQTALVRARGAGKGDRQSGNPAASHALVCASGSDSLVENLTTPIAANPVRGLGGFIKKRRAGECCRIRRPVKPAITYSRPIRTTIGRMGLTTEFGMGSGVSPYAKSPADRVRPEERESRNGLKRLRAVALRQVNLWMQDTKNQMRLNLRFVASTNSK